MTNLGLQLSSSIISDLESSNGERALDLLNKTNQWSLNGKKLDIFSLSRLMQTANLIVGSASDNSGDHGLVVAAMFDFPTFTISHMAISCRVIGLGLEDAFLAQFRISNTSYLKLDFLATERNNATQAYLPGLHASENSEGELLIELLRVPDHAQISGIEFQKIVSPASDRLSKVG